MKQELLDTLFRENFCRLAISHRDKYVVRNDETKCSFDIFVSEFRDDGSCLMSWRENGSFVKMLGYNSFEDAQKDISRILKKYKKFKMSILYIDPQTEKEVAEAAYKSFTLGGYNMEGEIGMVKNKKLFE